MGFMTKTTQTPTIVFRALLNKIYLLLHKQLRPTRVSYICDVGSDGSPVEIVAHVYQNTPPADASESNENHQSHAGDRALQNILSEGLPNTTCRTYSRVKIVFTHKLWRFRIETYLRWLSPIVLAFTSGRWSP